MGGAGLWILAYLDDGYPERLRERLQDKMPPILFGCGDRSLLGSGGLAVIGSRKAPARDLEYARAFGSAAAEEGVAIVSGGARGIDEAVMTGGSRE